MMLAVEIPLHIVSEANARGHWAKGARRAKEQRGVVRMVLASRLLITGVAMAALDRVEVRLVRVAPRSLDGDNLQRALKAVRDGVADWLRIDDGSTRIAWDYGQERRKPKEYGVRIEVRSGGASE